jgi:hypothetical protein
MIAITVAKALRPAGIGGRAGATVPSPEFKEGK